MTQHKNERPESKFQVLYDVKKLRNSIVTLCLRDFGVKSRTRTPDFYSNVYKMSEDDKEVFVEVLEKYGIVKSVLDEYPQWYIEKLRDRLLNNVFDLVDNVEKSNVYPTTVHECDVRRDYQNAALANLFEIYQWIELASITLPLDKNKFIGYFDDIERIIASIKKLRKSDNIVRKRLVNKEKKEIAAALSDLLDNNYNMSSKMLDKLLDLMLATSSSNKSK